MAHNCPSGKVAYPSPQAAQRVLGRVCKRNGGNKRAWTGGPLRVYRCPMCSDFHAGHGVPQGNHAVRRVDAKSRSYA